MHPGTKDGLVQIEALQESVHDEDYDYEGTPHLAHPELRNWIVELVSEAARRATSRGLLPESWRSGPAMAGSLSHCSPGDSR